MKQKIKVYLCDFVHNYLDVGTYMFPLNIGYIASYAKKFFPNEIEVKLFKYPSEFIKEFKQSKPDISGFSNYTWNDDLNNKMACWVKSNTPKAITIVGGPNITYSETGYKRFFATHNCVDFYVPYQGEAPFVNLLKEILSSNLDIVSLRARPISGVLSYEQASAAVIRGEDVPRLKDLDSIPSPYLTGELDEFFSSDLIPIMETNRGCPYTCTFCAQGLSSNNRLDLFSLERVKEELKYIASRVKNTNILNFADANFCIIERDMEIAKYIAKLSKDTNYPRKFSTNWAKNQPKIFEIAKILESSNLVVSLQSLDETVLKNIKRTNIKISVFKEIVDKINSAGGMSGTEIILGLPGETMTSHLKTIRDLFDWNVSYIICYNALILEGTEMSLSRERGEFNPLTKFRLIDNSFGKYNGILSFESEEGIRSTSSMSEEEILYFRPVHWLIQFLWNYRFYYDLLKYLQQLRINPLDYILKLIEEAESAFAPESIRTIFREFKRDSENEWFDSFQLLKQHYSLPIEFKSLEAGEYGKLNGKYIFRILLESITDFSSFLCQVAVNYSPLCQSKKAVFEDIINFHSQSIIDFSVDWQDASAERESSFKYDILAWRDSGYQGRLEQFYCSQGRRFRIYLPAEQKNSLELLLKQYAHENKNATLRKMSEYMYIKDFFRKTKVV